MLIKLLFTPVLMTSAFFWWPPVTNSTNSNSNYTGGWSGYATSPQRFEFFGKKAPFSSVLDTIRHPVRGNGSDVVLIYKNVAVILFMIPKEQSLKAIREDMFNSLPHKVITIDNHNKTKIVNLDM
ncbi:hypothetical protein CONCODRAFT_79681 [Conidiobolus coronatus NRRL 28638]|uniref:Uncharacterized protein n=1 Tax=Conidiobolus coronatus (strain ATCC 28846 / CBS 209.66 / NRRL 28638) TaxID=796925 RepID=A0A137P0S1_CONC2|nr:hypothetical protein CONCODRAFT_79681 [Conidiobolus coronatus NRRL 28638]|eukprot:KXN68627.1 hypothetical protein CONCODRAFT_79681 [Conidiobolus coronatus NRRL 28638]